MEIKEMQRQIDEYISQFKVGYFEPLALMARVSEEVGELAREINHHYGPKPKKPSEKFPSLNEEMGDVLFTILSMANALAIDMDEAFAYTMTKFNTRDKDRFERVDVMNRKKSPDETK